MLQTIHVYVTLCFLKEELSETDFQQCWALAALFETWSVPGISNCISELVGKQLTKEFGVLEKNMA